MGGPKEDRRNSFEVKTTSNREECINPEPLGLSSVRRHTLGFGSAGSSSRVKSRDTPGSRRVDYEMGDSSYRKIMVASTATGSPSAINRGLTSICSISSNFRESHPNLVNQSPRLSRFTGFDPR